MQEQNESKHDKYNIHTRFSACLILPMLIQKMSNKVILILQHLATEVTTPQVILVMHVAVNVVHSSILENQPAEVTAVNIRSRHQVVEKFFCSEIDQ